MQSKLGGTGDAHSQNADLRLEAHAGHSLLNRGEDPINHL